MASLWRLNLTNASIDGFTFLYKEVSNELGRGQELHEVPFSATPHHLEDLGPLATTYPIEAFFIGDNYMQEREDFLDIILAGKPPGVGMLFIHPYRGQFTVGLLGKIKLVEKDTEGGFATVSFTLVEIGPAFPNIPIHIPSKLSAAVVLFDTALIDTTLLSIVGAVGSVIGGIVGGLDSAAQALRVANAVAASKLGVVSNIGSSISAFTDEIGDLLNTPSEAIGAFVSIIAAAIDIQTLVPPQVSNIDIVIDVPDFAGILLGMFADLNTFESIPPTPPTFTTQGLIEQAAHQAITDTFKAVLTIQVTAQLVSLPVVSIDQADKLVQNIGPALELLLQANFVDEVLKQILNIRSLAVRYFAQAQTNLPRVNTVVLNDHEPSLVLASRLYGDSSRASDIVTRNNISNPLKLPPGVKLEYLADA